MFGPANLESIVVTGRIANLPFATFLADTNFRNAHIHGTAELRYMVVPNEFEAQITITQIMREMVQLNEGQPYTYDREALIAIMDGVLAELDE